MSEVINNFYYILGVVGGTLIITKSILFKSIREWVTKKSMFLGEGISCPMCVGFWMGIIVYLLNVYDLSIFIKGLSGSIVSYYVINKIK